ncbi:MAG: GntR family transcriptional regulator [Clostridiales bacterium]|nr:GntR family transcriptional regulator [Clostridiales bacterium]
MDFKENNKPIYMQLCDKLCDDIIAGVYNEESRIPSVREFAAMVEVNANTVVRSYDYLQQQELIYNKRGIGYFVTIGARKRIITERGKKFMEEELNKSFKQLSMMHITPDELRELYAKYLEQSEL